MCFGRAAHPCTALTRLFRLFNTQKGAARPPPPIGALLILPAKLMIFRENPARKSRDPLLNPHCCRSVNRVSVPGRDSNPVRDTLHPTGLRCVLIELRCTLKCLCWPGGYTTSANLSGQHGLILTAMLMINRENPAKGPSLGENPRKITPSHLVQ
jgi:hypothetical protein